MFGDLDAFVADDRRSIFCCDVPGVLFERVRRFPIVFERFSIMCI
jgi:hypothetical protein